jgi:hypothetical protein
MKVEQFSRLLHHRLTGEGLVFTNPTSNDHTDETWSETDLYIGEIGINVTDDRAFFRTNNGIVEFLTSGATSSTASCVWELVGGQVRIVSGLTPSAVARNANDYCDLGSSTLRFKDLYLGGSADGSTVINTNKQFTIRDAGIEFISNVTGASDAPVICMAATSSIVDRVIPLHLSTMNSYIEGTNGLCRTIISSTASVIEDNTQNISIIGGGSVTIKEGSSNVVYVGNGLARDVDDTNTLYVGGKMKVRSVTDDGTGTYTDSDIVRGQSRITTTNALATPIFAYTFSTSGALQFKAKVIGVSGDTAAYCVDVMVLCHNTVAEGATIIEEPIILEINGFSDPVSISVDGTGEVFTLSVIGTATDTIKWLCSYDYHVLDTNLK